MKGQSLQPQAPKAELEVEGQGALLLSDMERGRHCSLGGYGWTGSRPFLPVSWRRMASM